MALSLGEAALARRSAPALYRTLLRACWSVDPERYGHEENRLGEWATVRFPTEARALGRQLRAAHDEDAQCAARDAAEEAAERCARLIDAVDAACRMQPAENPAAFSCFAAAQCGAGNPAYCRQVEDGLLALQDFAAQYEERREEEGRRGSATKNRAMQAATRGYADVLAALDAADGADPGADAAEWQREVSERAPANAFLFYELPELVVVEVDRARRRQTIYVHGRMDLREGAGAHAAVQEWQREPAGVEFEQAAHLSALKVYEQLRQDKCLDPEFGTALAGHGFGGAVATVVGAYLSSDFVPVRNVITFGAPMVTPTQGNAALGALPILRVTTAVDAHIDTPAAAEDARPFVHYGEELRITPRQLAEMPEEYLLDNRVHVTMREYRDLVYEEQCELQYASAPEDLLRHEGYEDVIDKAEAASEFAHGKFSARKGTRAKWRAKKKGAG